MGKKRKYPLTRGKKKKRNMLDPETVNLKGDGRGLDIW